MTGSETTHIGDGQGVGPGTILNGIFEIDIRLAAGGMGEVYKGHNIATGDPVAIKVVLKEFAKDEMIVGLFFKEARVLNSLHHPAIVRYGVFSVDPVIERPYLVMEFVDGVSLADMIDARPMPNEEAKHLISRLASGLDAAHRAGVIHRDMSPDNVIVPMGQVGEAKIIDFGIARANKLSTGTLLGGKFAGKYNFVSPEQLGLFGGEVTDVSDVYSLGLLAANVLRGQPLNMTGTPLEVVEKRRVLPDLSLIDPEFRPILELMLQPNPSDRKASMAEIAEWLAPAAGLSRSVRRTPPRQLDRTILATDMPFLQANAQVQGEAGPGTSSPQPSLSPPAGTQIAGIQVAGTQVDWEGATRPDPLSSGANAPNPAPSPASDDHDPLAAIPIMTGSGLSNSSLSAGENASSKGAKSSLRRRWLLATVAVLIIAGVSVAVFYALEQKPEQIESAAGQAPVAPPEAGPDEAPAKAPGTKATVEPAPSQKAPPEPSPDSAAPAATAPLDSTAPAGQTLPPAATTPPTKPAPVPPDAPAVPQQPVPDQQPPVGSATQPNDSQPFTPPAKPPETTVTDTQPESQAKTPQYTAPPATEPSKPAPEPEPPAAAGPTSPVAQTPEPVAAPAPTGGQAVQQETGTGQRSSNPSKPEQAVAPPATVPAAENPADPELAWLRRFDGGLCFFLRATPTATGLPSIEALTAQAAPLEKLDSQFTLRFGVSPDIGGRLISDAQCSVVNFLADLAKRKPASLEFTLAKDEVRSGDPVHGTVNHLMKAMTVLYLIDNNGFVFRLDPTLKRQGDQATFGIEGIKLDADEPMPQILLALSTDRPIPGSLVTEPMKGRDLFRDLVSAIATNKTDLDYGFGYFTLQGK